MNNRSSLAFLIAGSLLTACSGSGGNSAMNLNPVPFTSFSAVQNGQPVQANGVSQTIGVGSTPTQLNVVDTTNSSAQVTYSGIGSSAPVITQFGFQAPFSNANFSNQTLPATAQIDCVTTPGECGAAVNGNTIGKVINALDPGVAFNYQSFGYWLVSGSFGSATATAMSFGSPTPAGAVPTTSSATYNGRSGGVYVDPTGLLFTFSGGMTSTVNFATRSISFATIATQVSPVSGGTLPALGSLAVSGTLTYAAGSSQFAGPVTAPGFPTGGGLSGNANGSFYGPAVGPPPGVPPEIGGVFSLNNTTTLTPTREAIVGGFGGKR